MNENCNKKPGDIDSFIVIYCDWYHILKQKLESVKVKLSAYKFSNPSLLMIVLKRETSSYIWQLWFQQFLAFDNPFNHESIFWPSSGFILDIKLCQ